MPIGLDFGAVLAMGQAMGADADMLAEALPIAETAILAALDLGGDGDASPPE